MTRITSQLGTLAALLAILLFSICCGQSVRQPIQRTTSRDGRYLAFVHLDRGGVMVGGDWYAVILREARPTWRDYFERWNTVCTLQGPGRLRIHWSGSKKLVVTCTNCDRREFFIDKREWKGVKIEFLFPSSPKAVGSVFGGQPGFRR